MKKMISLFLAFLMMTAGLTGCSLLEQFTDGTKESASTEDLSAESTDATTEITTDKKDPDQTPVVLEGTKYALNNTATWLKKLDPRMESTSDHITCDWSASGIEFTATLKGDVSFEVNTSTKMGGGKEGCYFRAYVDGEAYLNGTSPYYELQKGVGVITLKNIPEGTHTIKLVKVSGYTLANVELKNVYLNGTVSDTAPADKELFIEFVGDSMSCGWGVIGDHQGAYTDQDATLAFPYLISDALNADYSVVAVSGQGIIKGNPGITGGYRYPSPYRSTAKEYGFARKADVIVINADTNDAYDKYSPDRYHEALKNFVEYARQKNGVDTHIILVCNMMKTDYADTIAKLVRELGGAQNRYYYYKADTAKGVYSAHPTAEENITYASEIGGMISAILAGRYYDDDGAVPPTIPVNTTIVYRQNFVTPSTAPEAGVTTRHSNTLKPTVEDGKLYIPKTAWGSGPFASLIDSSAFSSKPGIYIVEMDVELKNDLQVFGFMLNQDFADANRANESKNNVFVALRRGTTNAQGAINISNGAMSDDYDVYFRTILYDENGGQIGSTTMDRYATDITNGVASFKLTMVVDSTRYDGCRVNLFVDGEYVCGVSCGEAWRVTENSRVLLWAENSEATIDNLFMRVVNE